MKRDLTHRFGFLVNDVARLYGRHFDQLAREQIGLSRAQCRLLGALAMQDEPMSQAALAERLDLSAMAVAGLCDRMEAGGWVRRAASASDRRINEIHLEPRAELALESALAISDSIHARAMAGLDAAERAQLLALLRRVHTNLAALASEPAAS
ncbi:MarR family winged helix-turn-helix transcriptional regulator [Variovorax terrae]|uniref:MarR family transcriptional regulator n=1 Tax=Variovorax terrae TaxID=2923278 RepID=A0A9X1VTC9_9BURK|nr:MarR family transcriptional regulator [Variovorax terrae]MCJ0761669.1 MarR family transcriptional regulator [Variovorax terrae]